MEFKQDDYLKLVATNGNFRYGYVSKNPKNGFLEICMLDEGESKIAYDEAWGKIHGESSPDWVRDLTLTEKKLIPLLAQGYTTEEMGVRLKVSPITIRAHIRNLRLKFHLENRVQLSTYAQGIQNVLLKSGSS